MKHELKTDNAVFDSVWTKVKQWEVRINDREFRVGDLVILRETKFSGEQMAAGKPLEYTGREVVARIMYILNGPVYGIKDGWCVFGIGSCTNYRSE